MHIPQIRLELTGMKEAIIFAFNERQAAQDVDVRAAVEAYCTPENLNLIIGAAVRETLDRAIKETVDHFYRYGDGRGVVKEAVQQRLARGETELG
jgi:hypothetical protein